MKKTKYTVITTRTISQVLTQEIAADNEGQALVFARAQAKLKNPPWKNILATDYDYGYRVVGPDES